ncbi:UDP-N-acetylglucosamine transferase subunit ALG13 homolog [Phlebotomus argentipes]|uniref:UDP-N-acetylglucosamine transferase subunit ALG13 homolog n=1 Tax=Phlebotomus argentipes TaxID=94469 RepID=UPI002892E432|nr:UDP-N-acetylglucosamine transferase subunit ALG13 homolog [Phlebotomus argentipes]
MEFPKVLVTVGTTSFPELISAVNTREMVEILKNRLKCHEITVQSGKNDLEFIPEFKDLSTKSFHYSDAFRDCIRAADLVISHAGAGTCMEVLAAGKALVVVVNDTLMDNHQTELADQLASENCLVQCIPASLCQTLREFDPSKLKKYEKGDPGRIVEEIDKLMGFQQ